MTTAAQLADLRGATPSDPKASFRRQVLHGEFVQLLLSEIGQNASPRDIIAHHAAHRPEMADIPVTRISKRRLQETSGGLTTVRRNTRTGERRASISYDPAKLESPDEMVVVLLHEAEHVYDIARGHMPLYDTHVWFEQGGERLCFLPGHHHDWVDFGVEYPLAALQQQTLQPKPLPTRITHTAGLLEVHPEPAPHPDARAVWPRPHRDVHHRVLARELPHNQVSACPSATTDTKPKSSCTRSSTW